MSVWLEISKWETRWTLVGSHENGRQLRETSRWKQGGRTGFHNTDCHLRLLLSLRASLCMFLSCKLEANQEFPMSMEPSSYLLIVNFWFNFNIEAADFKKQTYCGGSNLDLKYFY